MDTEATDAAAASSPVSFGPPKENGGDSLSHSHPPAAVVVVEDDYETASESEDSDENAPMPIEKDGSPNKVLSEDPDINGDSDRGGSGEVEAKRTAVGSSAADENGVSDGSGVKVEILGGGLYQDVPSSEGRDEKDEALAGGSSPEVANSAAEVEGESKDRGFVAGAEGNGGDFAGDERKDENEVDGLKLVEVEAEAGGEENGEPSAQDEKKEEGLDGNGQSEVITTSPVVEVKEEEAESKPEMPKMERSDAITAAGSVEEPAVEAEKEVAVDIVASDKNLEEAAEDSEPVEVELNAADAQNVDGVVVESKAEEEEEEKEEEEETNAAVEHKETDVVGGSVESKAVEEENEVVAAEKSGAADSLDAIQDLGEAAELKAVEEETDAVAAEKDGVPDSVNANQVLEEAAELSSVEKDTSASEAVKNEAADGASLQRSPDLETDEKAVSNSDKVLTDLETKPSDGCGDSNPPQDVEPPSASAEDSTSKETETSLSENSGAVESGTASEIAVESLVPVSDTAEEVEPEADGFCVADDDENPARDEAEEEEDDDSVPDQQPRVAILDSSKTAEQIIKEMEEGSSSTSFESSRSYQHPMDGQIVSDSDEEVDTDDEGDGKELFDSAALAALLKAATGASSDGNITVTSQDGTRVFSVDRPAGLGSSAPALRPAPGRSARPTLFSPSELAVTGEPEDEMDEEERKLHAKVEDIRVKFLRLVMRLGHTSEDTVAAQVLYRLSLAEGLRRGRQMGRAFSTETAKKKAIQLEAEGEEDLNFSCNILVLGKTGVGKSATINSIFGEEKSHTDAFQTATTSVKEISGVVDGVKIRIIDTPGLKSSVMDQATNRRILSSIKKYTKKCPPDIVLYVDRLDTQTRDFNDLPLLRSITSALGSSIWFNAIVALTHAASAPPEGPNGSPLSYEVFIAQRSHVVQHSIRQAAGDMRLMNPVALVENHPSCRRNREGERVLPNGLSWRPQMLLLCYSSKILSEANSLLKLQDQSPGKLFGFRTRSPPLPYLLSTLLQSRPHPKLSSELGGDNGDSDIDLDDFSDAEDEEEDEYDQLPPFKPLKKSQLPKLTKEQRRAYFDEYDYRVKLLQKKQFKEEIRRLKEMKNRGKNGRDDSPYGDMSEDYDQDGAPAAVPVPLPDMVLPPSFDCDVPTYRYRFLEPTSQLLTRPVLDTHGWDHDCGYDGVSLEESLAIANRFPAAVAVQITKDKKDFNIHLDSSVAAKHGENGSTLAGFDIQSVGKQLAYILRSETKFKNLKKNKTAAGISVTFLGETVATGLKVEDQLMIGKRVVLVASTGAVRAQGDVAYGANLEARLREKDYPIGQALSTLGLSLMKWRGDLALGANLQSQVNIGRNSKVSVRVGLNNKLSGQITVRTSTSEQLQLALVGIIPVALSVFRSIWPGESDMGH